MIFYKADDTFKIEIFTKSQESAEFYNLTQTCDDDGIEQAYNGFWYLKGHAPQKPHNEVILEEINALEAELSPRNIRAAFLGDEYALIKIKNIEEQISELRKQLDKLQGA